MKVNVNDEVSLIDADVMGVPVGSLGKVLDVADTSAYVRWFARGNKTWISMRHLKLEQEAEIESSVMIKALDLVVEGAIHTARGLSRMSDATKRMSIIAGAFADRERQKTSRK